MARSSATTTFLAVMLTTAALSTGAYAATCDGQKLDNTYDSCIDLPHLGSFLHYTYDPANTSISIAFIAKPATSAGWVAWGINPAGPYMIGTQAFVAYVAGGVVAAKTYNVTGNSPSSVIQEPLSFATWDVSGQSFGSSGEYVIYAKAKVPVASQKKLAHVWQVGPSVNGSLLGIHALTPDNMASAGTIDLSKASVAPAPSPSGSSILGSTPAASPRGSIGTPSPSPAASPPAPPLSGPSSAGGPSPSPSSNPSPSPSPSPSPNPSPSPSPASSGKNATAPAPSSSGRFRLGFECVIAAVVVLFSFVFF